MAKAYKLLFPSLWGLGGLTPSDCHIAMIPIPTSTNVQA